ncbi:Uncharacterised protein [Mycobacteroides abscessus subsp. massiliense]|nr:Uncharacterised protein [Mycobacteroides abscessus subsp. massiliense]
MPCGFEGDVAWIDPFPLKTSHRGRQVETPHREETLEDRVAPSIHIHKPAQHLLVLGGPLQCEQLAHMGRVTTDNDLPPPDQPGPHKVLHGRRPPPRRQATLHELLQHELSHLRSDQMITLYIFQVPLEIVVGIRLGTVVHAPPAVPLLGFLKYLLLHRPRHVPIEMQTLGHHHQMVIKEGDMREVEGFRV